MSKMKKLLTQEELTPRQQEIIKILAKTMAAQGFEDLNCGIRHKPVKHKK